MAMSVAIKPGPKGITSNVIALGLIADTEGMSRLSKKEVKEKAHKAILSSRFGTVKEIADATVYLFLDAGNFVDGETLVVDSGAWRTTGNMTGFEYPDFLLLGKSVNGVAGSEKSKL
jgi:peroxisomal 2,4-dienoyl-CoA reductase